MPESRSRHKPYRLLGREIRGRLRQANKTRQEFASAVGLHVNHIHSILAGLRAFPAEKLDGAAEFLASRAEKKDDVKNRLLQLDEPGISRVHLLYESLGESIILGYVDWPPFVQSRGVGDGHPRGLLIELTDLLFKLAGANVSWRRLAFKTMLSDLAEGEVDAVMGFVLDSMRRRTRAHFLPLGMPFAVGVNAVTRAPEFTGQDAYEPALRKIQRGTKRPRRGKIEPLSVVVVEGEIAHDYFLVIAPDTPDPLVTEGSISEAIRLYTKEEHNVVFADSVSCEHALRFDRDLKQVFSRPVGRFAGGFLFPIGDPEWVEFFATAFDQLLKARLPETGQIFSRYADDLQSFVDADSVEEWIRDHWPREVPLPASWPLGEDLRKEYAIEDSTVPV